MSKNDDLEETTFKDTTHYLTRLYIIALSCIALLAIIGQILIQYSLQKQQEDSYIINVAGRQRMLSQNICKLSLLIKYSQQNKERENYIRELNNVLSKWETFHNGLCKGNKQLGLIQQNSDKIQELFFLVNPYFQKMAESARKIIAISFEKPFSEELSTDVETILKNEGEFLKGMDNIVLQYQIEAKRKVTFVQKVEIILFALTLLVLLLEGIFIFRPSAIKIRNTIDRLKLMQEELSRTNIELEEKVKKRTEDVFNKNQELKLKNEELYKKNTDLDTFVYVASHDLKAPINNIDGLFNLLCSDIPESEKKNLTEMIRESINKFKNVIKDLAETGKEQVNAKTVNTEVEFKEICSEIKFNIKNLINSTHAIIQEDFSDAPKINFSKRNIRSILYNLISNAIKYCPADRKPELKISTKNLKDYILLTVSDNGIGIKEEDKKRVFSLYQRLESNPERSDSQIEGTGVGMAIVAKIVDSNGGKIEIESIQGKGSIFKVYLKTIVGASL
jgi:signal transduction histidine kinase